MNEMVKIENNSIVVAKESIQKLKEFQKVKLQMELLEKEIKNGIKEAMKKTGTKQFFADGIYADITQVKGRTTIDTKKLKEELPEIAEQYTVTGEPTERFTFKIDVQN